MKKPEPGDKIRCPDAPTAITCWVEGKQQQIQPERVFDAPDQKDSRQLIRYGILGKHKHGMLAPECAWSGLVVKLEEREERSLTCPANIGTHPKWKHWPKTQ